MAIKLVFFFILMMLNSLKGLSQLHYRPTVDTNRQNVKIRVLPQNFYIKTLSFVCKKEVQLQKAISFPLFIRIGSKEQVDYLERKPNTFIGKKPD
ncbi:MAG TPA: hypothetical protein VFQ73_13065 [Flavisolibacter sp.]|nr:hypothetical protein [Flavisolibacter sp.]